MARLTLIQAVNQALLQEMERDSKVVVMGEDVGRDGGVFRATEGLWQKFGGDRVIDTPLAESGIVGTAIGMAAYGLKPVAEIQFDGFIYPALDQLISHAAKLRNRTRGRFHVPLVVRVPWGGGIKALEHHSESPEALFAHMPGMKVVIPSSPYDAKGLLISSIRDPDPVIFFEPKKIYRAFREDVPEEPYTIPLGEAKVVREGSDVSVITYGSLVREAVKAAEQAAQENVSVEVVDLRTVFPLDRDAILETAKKTGRVIALNEAPRCSGLAGEVAAVIAEHEDAIFSLES